MHQDQEMPRAKTSKSAKIREALTATPDKPVVEIAKEFGVKPGLVYNVKANMKKKAGKAKGKPGRKPGKKSAPKVVVSHAAHDALGTAVDFVIKVGGLRHAEQLLSTLKAIKEQL
jgi:transposase